MSEIVIRISVPDGVAVTVEGPASLHAAPAAAAGLPPQGAAAGPVVEGPQGQCPKHLKPWRAGNKGPYCSAKDPAGYNGYCSLKPGDVWNGQRAMA